MDDKSPCIAFDCKFRYEEKNNKRCFNCKLRIEYAERQKRTMEKPGYDIEDFFLPEVLRKGGR